MTQMLPDFAFLIGGLIFAFGYFAKEIKKNNVSLLFSFTKTKGNTHSEDEHVKLHHLSKKNNNDEPKVENNNVSKNT